MLAENWRSLGLTLQRKTHLEQLQTAPSGIGSTGTRESMEAVITTFRMLGTFMADCSTDTVPFTTGVR